MAIDFKGISKKIRVNEVVECDNVKMVQVQNSGGGLYCSFHEITDTNKGVLLKNTDVMVIGGTCYLKGFTQVSLGDWVQVEGQD